MGGVMTKLVYDIIKKQNGEAFAKAIRNYDSGIFDVPDLARIVRYAGRNALPLLPFLESLKEIQIEEVPGHLSPFKLLELAGYDAYYADTLEKQNAIQKYFESYEKLCTFNDNERYNNYYIINAVKKNVQKIKRKDFYGIESRQDAYGTSVISIQILKKGGFISIKNRYNHTVPGCDNTFNSNPDNIIEGLSFAIKKYFNVDFSSRKVLLREGYTYQNNQIFKYGLECNNIYYGEDFYLKDGVVYPLNKDCQMMAIPFIFDLKKREVLSPSGVRHCFDGEIKDGILQVIKQGDERVLTLNGRPVVVTKNGQIKKLCLLKTKELGVCSFSGYFKMLETIEAPLLKTLEAGSFNGLKNLKKASFPVLENLSKDTFTGTSGTIFAPKLAEKGIIFFASLGIDVLNKQVISQGIYSSKFITFLNQRMFNNQVTVQINDDGTQSLLVEDEELLKFRDGKLISFTLPEMNGLKTDLIYNLPDLEEVNLSKVTGCISGGNFNNCPKLKKVFLPNVTEIGSNVFCNCESLEEINCPKVLYLEWHCVRNNPHLKRVFMPELRETKDECFCHNGYETLSLPNLEKVKSNCFCYAPKLKKLDLPFLSYTKERCFCDLNEIEELTLPSLISYWGECSFLNNKNLKKVRLNEIEVIRARSFINCPNLEIVVLDKASVILENSLCELPALETVIAPEIDSIDENVLSHCEKLKSVYMPHLRLIKRDNFYNTPLLSVLYAPNAAFEKEENLETQKPTVVVQKKLPASMEKYIQQFDFER